MLKRSKNLQQLVLDACDDYIQHLIPMENLVTTAHIEEMTNTVLAKTKEICNQLIPEKMKPKRLKGWYLENKALIQSLIKAKRLAFVELTLALGSIHPRQHNINLRQSK